MLINYKAAVIGFSYFFGLLLGSCFDFHLDFIFGTVLLIIAALVYLIKKKTVLIALLASSFGFLVYGANDFFVYSPIVALDGETRAVSGVITDKSEPSNDTARYTVSACIDGVTTKISFFTADFSAEVGDKVSFEAVLYTFTDNTSFAERSYNFTKGILLEATKINSFSYESVNEKSALTTITSYIKNLNEFLKNKIITEFPGDYGALICATFLGDKSYISDALSSDILRTGFSHFTSVSGMHLVAIVSFFIPMFDLIRSRYKRQIKFTALLIIILFFMVFFGPASSVLRSGIMLIVFFGGDLFLRKRSSFNSIGITLFIILIFQPHACRDIGLLLSIAGCFGIGVAAPAINVKMNKLPFRTLRENIVTVLCANFFTVPVAGIFFGGFSTVSLITNIVLTPIASALLLTILLYMLCGGTMYMFLFLSALCSKAIIEIIQFLSGFYYAYFSLEYSFLLPWTAAALIYITSVHLAVKKLSATVKSSVISIIVLITMITASDIKTADDTFVQTFSDGNSAAVVVRQKDSCVIVATDDSKNVRSFINGYLRNRFMGEASVLCLLNSSYNSLLLFSELPHKNIITPEMNKSFDVNNIIMVSKTDASAFILVNDVTISVSKISEADNNADIQVLFGYKENVRLTSDKIIFVSSRQTAEYENETNAYYEKTQFYIRNN